RQPADHVGLPQAHGAADSGTREVAAGSVGLSTIMGRSGMPTAGFIYPDHAAEDDYPFAERLFGNGVALPVRHIYGTDLHAVPGLLDLGSEARLAEGAALLAADEPDSVVWACTSGSFVYEWEGAHEQVEKLAAAAGKPASCTSFAFVR